MKKLNLYYVVSIVVLVVMMFILYRTLQVTGWFDEPEEQTPAERCFVLVQGNFQLNRAESTENTQLVSVKAANSDNSIKSLVVSLDSIETYFIELSDFENEEVLVELFSYDSANALQRMDGCELLLTIDSLGQFKGGTIGDFCGLKEQSTEYLVLDLLLSGPSGLLEIQTGELKNPHRLDSRKLLLERIDSW